MNNTENKLNKIVGPFPYGDWKKANNYIKKLRRRIFKNTQKQDWVKVRSLQRLMLGSHFNILLSIRRVTMGGKGETPGFDGLTYSTSSERNTLYLELMEYSKTNINNWQPRPVKRIYIPKPDGRKRPVGIPTVLDRCMQAIVLNALEPEWEARNDFCNYGFRPGKGPNDAVARIYSALRPKDRLWIVEADLTCCFDNINHDYLLDKLKGFPALKLIGNWLKAGIMFDSAFLETLEGTPQGGVLSPLLSNIALNGIDTELGIKYTRDSKKSSTGMTLYSAKKSQSKKYVFRTMVRFADDFVIICVSKQTATDTIDLLIPILSKRGLRLSELKTKITHASNGFDFVGFNIKVVKSVKSKRMVPALKNLENGEIEVVNPKVLTTWVQPSQKSISKMKERLKDLFSRYHNNLPGLIKKVNASIRGYTQSKNYWSVSKAYSELDHYLFTIQCRYCYRKHPKKGWKWLKEQYFSSFLFFNIKTKWAFTMPGSNLVMYKFRFFFGFSRINNFTYSPVPMNHCKDDPACDEFWKLRRGYLTKIRGIDFLALQDRRLADSQDQICPICEDDLHNGESLHRHHIIEVSKGGGNEVSNLILIHSPCHFSIHGNKYESLWKNKLLLYRESHKVKSVEAFKATDNSLDIALLPWVKEEDFDLLAIQSDPKPEVI